MKSHLFFQHADVFQDCWEHSGLEVAKFEDTLATLPSSALQPKPLPSILKTIKSTRRIQLNVSVLDLQAIKITSPVGKVKTVGST